MAAEDARCLACVLGFYPILSCRRMTVHPVIVGLCPTTGYRWPFADNRRSSLLPLDSNPGCFAEKFKFFRSFLRACGGWQCGMPMLGAELIFIFCFPCCRYHVETDPSPSTVRAVCAMLVYPRISILLAASFFIAYAFAQCGEVSFT